MNHLRRFLVYLRGYKHQLVLAVLLTIALAGLTLPYPLIVREMLDNALPNQDWARQRWLMALFLVIFLCRGGLGYLNRFLLQRIGMRVTCDLRKDIFAHLQTLSLKYYESRQTGRIVARITEDTGALFSLITGVLVNLISDSVTVLAVFAMLFKINWKLAVATSVVLPLFFLNYKFSQRRLRVLSRRHRRHWGRVMGFLHERVAGARLVQSFSMERLEIERFNAGIETDYRNYNALALYNTRLWVVADMISSLGVLLVLAYGGWLVIAGELSIGSLIAFNTYIGFLFAPIVRFSDLNAIIEKALTALEKIHQVMDTPSFVVEAPGAVALPPARGQVEFQDVHFSYDAHRRVLKDISFTAAPGQLVALVGPSGSGKTTLINLLCRFYDVDGGAILLDGTDIRHVTLASLRRQIGFVMQESLLFSGKLVDNIRYGRPGASMDDIIGAATAANAHDFIQQLPLGYESLVGERGVKLSGGQKQRIAIARAILKQPAILIFDEATSALDSESERIIQEAMERFMRGRTTFVIAHRLSTIMRADQILVLQAGAIVERGAHAELLAQAGVYRGLYDLQFRA